MFVFHSHTLICICIHTPVKRHYINTIFETTKNDRKRVATDSNFLSFIYIDVKGFSLTLGKRKFTGSEMPDHESYTSTFFQYFTTQKDKKIDASTFKF